MYYLDEFCKQNNIEINDYNLKMNLLDFIKFKEINYSITNDNYFYYAAIYLYQNDKDIPLIINILEHGLYLQNKKCAYSLGYIYEKDLKDYTLMKKFYNISAQNMNEYAMVHLGVYYSSIEQDYVLMKKYLEKACELNNTQAMILLGRYYHKIEDNQTLMFKYYKMALDIDITNGKIYHYMASFFKSNNKPDNMILNYNKAIYYKYHKSAFKLGLYYYNKKNITLAESFFLKGTNYNNAKCYLYLGLINIKLNNYYLIDKYFSKAIEYKNYEAYYHLGDYYAKFNNFSLAIKNYLKSIEILSDDKSMFKVGIYYLKIEKNIALATQYLKLAAEKNNINALLCLNTPESYLKAIELKCPIAMLRMAQYYSYNEENKNNVLAKKYYFMAMKYNNPDAKYEFAQYFKKIESNMNLYKKILTEAARDGHEKAKLELTDIIL